LILSELKKITENTQGNNKR